jgi:hypothetical protein
MNAKFTLKYAREGGEWICYAYPSGECRPLAAIGSSRDSIEEARERCIDELKDLEATRVLLPPNEDITLI